MPDRFLSDRETLDILTPAGGVSKDFPALRLASLEGGKPSLHDIAFAEVLAAIEAMRDHLGIITRTTVDLVERVRALDHKAGPLDADLERIRKMAEEAIWQSEESFRRITDDLRRGGP